MTRQDAEQKSRAFAVSIGRPTLADLRRAPASELLARSRAAGFSMSLPIDGRYLPEPPCQASLAGRQARVPLITGYVADEQFGWQPPLPQITSYSQYEAAVRHLLAYYGGKGVADTFLGMVPPSRWRPEMAEPSVRGYAVTGWQTESWAEAMSRITPNVYFYRFDQVPAGLVRHSTRRRSRMCSTTRPGRRDTRRTCPHSPRVRPISGWQRPCPTIGFPLPGQASRPRPASPLGPGTAGSRGERRWRSGHRRATAAIILPADRFSQPLRNLVMTAAAIAAVIALLPTPAAAHTPHIRTLSRVARRLG